MQFPTIKAVFFDVDGTLISFNTHTVPQSTLDAIQQLKEKGIKVILSTGRSINNLDHIQHLGFNGYSTFNGGYCVSEDGAILHRATMDPTDIERLIAYSKETPISFSLMSEKEVTIHHITPEIDGMYEKVNLPTPPLVNFETLDTGSILQVNVFIHPELEDEFMANVMPNSVATRWIATFADVNPSGQSKKIGIEKFCQYFGFDVSETMAFGDGGNDIEMLKYAGLGVAMGNANTAVKESADYVTDHVDEDGIWNALAHFRVI
ncbi:Cof-type HAD-IIB family hydrolase [Sphingobacterium sp. lm-10]|uniref:Cof-type HAD-IIB family hydrolase n=1 Tax=Sphingobacterium sp. lm-10 TaxID=2944904 RepID=UPI0020224106|nr:Cof-type HAD-IIB family hydrolase [Sphingobacterium sp. lm-10]MCL7986984.1 Cof-type HAD-IIB family hydrolase [Sphingobacterium sp. lm-10]